MILTSAVGFFVSTAASAVFAANVLASVAIGLTGTIYSRFSGHLPVTMVGLHSHCSCISWLVLLTFCQLAIGSLFRAFGVVPVGAFTICDYVGKHIPFYRCRCVSRHEDLPKLCYINDNQSLSRKDAPVRALILCPVIRLRMTARLLLLQLTHCILARTTVESGSPMMHPRTVTNDLLKHVAFPQTLSGILVLVPGGLGVRGSAALLEHDLLSGVGFTMDMLVVSLSITLGLLIAKIVLPSVFFGSSRLPHEDQMSLAAQMEDDRDEGTEGDEEDMAI